MDVIVGTAGHIDHGKTALVRALTGIDADRLPEEKHRGITIDLGFAEMSFGDVHFGFVDVPGHERFVKNMLAGASGIDVVLLIIAADEGVMPQTREHFDICRLLGVKTGLIALTKTDLVDDETLELAKLDATELVAGSFLENAPVIPLSSKTGIGIDSLKQALALTASHMPARDSRFVTRLPIDRSFSVKGFGAVVTGTLVSGRISEGDEVELLPSRTKVRVRGVQTHGKTISSAESGRRVAVNLGGISHSKVERGMVLSEPGILKPTQIVDTEIELLASAGKPLRSRNRIRVHINTTEALARVQILNDKSEIGPGEKDFAQIRFETPVTAAMDERFIIRSYSPQATIGGGRTIDVSATKHRRKDMANIRNFLTKLIIAGRDSVATVNILIEAAGPAGVRLSEIQRRTALNQGAVSEAIQSALAAHFAVDIGGTYVESRAFQELTKSVETAVGQFHSREPLAKGMSRGALRDRIFEFLPIETFHAVLSNLESSGRLAIDHETVRLTGHSAVLSPENAALRDKLSGIYRSARLEVPKLDEALETAIAGTTSTKPEARKIFQMFLDSREIVKVTDEFYFTKRVLDDLTELLKQFAATTDRSIDVPKFKEIAGVSRKYAIPLIEYLDRERITRRVGDKRIIL